MNKILITILCLALISLACLSSAALEAPRAVESIGTTPTLTNVRPAVAPSVTPTARIDAAGESCAVVIADVALNLRGGGSVDDVILNRVKRGDVLQVLSKSDPDWWRVSFAGVEGFARSSFLDERNCSHD
jgi:uncharacterized protein YgiM (DUF1202 family)